MCTFVFKLYFIEQFHTERDVGLCNLVVQIFKTVIVSRKHPVQRVQFERCQEGILRSEKKKILFRKMNPPTNNLYVK